ncbi:MAG: methyltransferase protein [Bacteroidota bacterium]|nr:methyltransferase protein [Bacteroidota bacterium]
MNSIFISIYRLLKGRLPVTISLFAGCIVVMLLIASKVELKEDVIQMLPEEKSNKNAYEFLQSSKFTERIIVSISAKDTNSVIPDSLVQFADAFVEQVNTKLRTDIKSIDYTASDSLFREVLTVIDNNLPVFLDDKDYAAIDSSLTNQAISQKLNYNFQTLTSPAGLALKNFIIRDPLGFNNNIYKKLKGFQLDDNIELYDNHFVTKDRKHLLVFLHLRAQSSETAKNAECFLHLDEAIKTATKNTILKVSYFGETAVATANAAQIRKDSILTSVITIVLLILLFATFFRSIISPVLVMLPVIFGGLFALMVIYFLKGSISIIAVGAGSIVLGIAVNYSLHFLTHYLYHPQKETVIKDLAFPMIVGSATTIGGFFSLQFLSIPVLRDLGLFAAFSLIGAALSTLIFLPHFIPDKNTHLKSPRFENFSLRITKLAGNKYAVIIFLILTIVLYHFAGNVQFENDMTKMNYMTPQLKNAEKEFNQFSSLYQKSVFIISKGKTMEEALAVNEKILPVLNNMKTNGSIYAYTNISSIWVSETEQKSRIAKWNQFWTSEKRTKTLATLNNEGKKLHFNTSAFTGFAEQTSRDYHPLSPADIATLKSAILNNFINEKTGNYTIINIVKAPRGKTNMVYKQLSKFKNISVVDRQSIINKLVSAISNDFNFITLLTTLIVFLALLISYGRIELTLIAFIPMVVSWIWILGFMALFGIKFNIVNIILSTFVFALGDDFCIFTMDSMQQEYAEGKKMSASVRISILLSAMTTILGLGILIFAKHPALKSIALVSIIGIISVWLMSQTLQPFLFNLLIQKQTDNKRFPITFSGFIKSLFAFSYFVFGAFVLTIIGVLLTKLIPFQRKKMKYAYHFVLSKFVGSLVYVMANVNKKIVNEHKENFAKPAVIIANHQSFLDILVLLMLHPKMIMLTNNWVWNSPVFGFVVRMADFQIAVNTDAKIDKIADLVKDGYSIIVYPEGTRSKDGVIKRFHKGAFYLAEKLNIDILPIVLHGTGYCMTKGEFLLKNGLMTVKILDRIKPSDKKYGVGYSERTTVIAKYFKEEFAKLSEETETPEYYRDQLISNYLFKGPILEWYLKVKLKLENNYAVYNEIIPKKNKILDIGCGYGFLSYMLSFTGAEREILGIDYDEDKINVAKHGFLKSRKLIFKHYDILEYQFEKYDTIILSDVLHYLQPNEQNQVLTNCIQHISDSGMVIVREGDEDMKGKHHGTRLTEFISRRLISFNKTAGSSSFLSYRILQEFATAHHLKLTRIDETKYTSNVLFILKKI